MALLAALPKKNKKKVRQLDPIAIPAVTLLDSTAGRVLDHSVKADKVSSKARRKSHELLLLHAKSDAIVSVVHTAPVVKRTDAHVITSSNADKHTTLNCSNKLAPIPTTISSSSNTNTSKHVPPRPRKRLTLQIKGPTSDTSTTASDPRNGGVIEIELCSDSIKTTLPKLKLHSLLHNIKLHRGIHNIPVLNSTEEVDSIKMMQQPPFQCSRDGIDSADDFIEEDNYYEDDFIEDEVTPAAEDTKGDCDKMNNQQYSNSDIIDDDGRKDSTKDSAVSADEHDWRVIVDDAHQPADVADGLLDNGVEQRKAKHVMVPPLSISDNINYESDAPDEEEGEREREVGQQATIPQTEEEEGEGEGEYVDDFTEDDGDLLEEDDDDYDDADDDYYDDDEFLSDGGDVEQEKSWGLVESMDEYNWVTGGAFVPPTGGINTATIIDDIRSPIKPSSLLVYEASLPFKAVDRIELLSRGSSSGFSFRPTSTTDSSSSSRESRYRKYMGSGRINSTTGDQLSPVSNHNILINAWEISSPTPHYVDSSIAGKLSSEIQEGQSVDDDDGDDQNDQSMKGMAASRMTNNTHRKVFEKTKKLKTKYSKGLKPTWKS